MQEDKLQRSYLSGWQGALIPDKLLPLDRNAPDQRQVSAHNLTVEMDGRTWPLARLLIMKFIVSG